MSFYLDASVIVPLILRDAHTPSMESWLTRGNDTLVVSDLGALEMAAVVSRSVRMGRISPQAGNLALALFDDWAERTTTRIETAAADMALADRFVRDFATKLAGPDALHLALAMNHGHRLVTFDERLAEAARMRGAGVVAPD